MHCSAGCTVVALAPRRFAQRYLMGSHTLNYTNRAVFKDVENLMRTVSQPLMPQDKKWGGGNETQDCCCICQCGASCLYGPWKTELTCQSPRNPSVKRSKTTYFRLITRISWLMYGKYHNIQHILHALDNIIITWDGTVGRW